VADLALPLLKAVITALKANDTVSSLADRRVYSDIGQGTAFPYLLVTMSAEPFAADDFSGQVHTIRVQAFSRQKSPKEALQLRAAVMEALDRQEDALSVDDLVMIQLSGMPEPFKEDDGKTWQSIIEFEATTA
jgi:hypothetical protein